MNKKLIFILSLLILSSVITTSVWAAATNTCYTFETGVPFIAGKGECKAPSGLANMIVSLIPILFRIAGVLAFVMIVVAGFQYATSGGDINKQKDAQDRIINAIIGLVLLFAFYLIIYTINPDILNIQELSLKELSQPNVSITYPPSGSLEEYKRIAKLFTGGEPNKGITYNQYLSNPGAYSGITAYLDALKNLAQGIFEGTHGMSCDVYVATVLKSTIFKDIPWTDSPSQYQALKKSSLFTCTYDSKLSASKLQDGDIIFADANNNCLNENQKQSGDCIDHIALWFDGGRWQASKNEYLPNGPRNGSDSILKQYHFWWYCRYIHFAGGGS